LAPATARITGRVERRDNAGANQASPPGNYKPSRPKPALSNAAITQTKLAQTSGSAPSLLGQFRAWEPDHGVSFGVHEHTDTPGRWDSRHPPRDRPLSPPPPSRSCPDPRDIPGDFPTGSSAHPFGDTDAMGHTNSRVPRSAARMNWEAATGEAFALVTQGRVADRRDPRDLPGRPTSASC
jgi:hypothetical protein